MRFPRDDLRVVRLGLLLEDLREDDLDFTILTSANGI